MGSASPDEMPLIDVIVNGAVTGLPAGITLAGLVARLALAGRYAVERNGEIIPRSAHGACVLAPGDRIEVVQAIGGG